MKDRSRPSQPAELTALKALEFLAREPERLGRFLALNGVAPQDIRALAGDPGFLGGVLDHLLEDETLLFQFAQEEGLAPEGIAALRRALPGRTVQE